MLGLVGVDEVGRGPLAGPVVACACLLPATLNQPWLQELADSKTLSAPKREKLAALLQANALFALGEASVEEIDSLNIRNASLLAMRRAVTTLAADYTEPFTVVVDGNVPIPELPWPQTTMVQADAKVPCVSAASIIAKVARDTMMQHLHARYPAYGWASNAGYGSAAHLAALKQHGPTPHHRHSFAPVKLAADASQTKPAYAA